MPHIEQILTMAGVAKQELTAIAVSIGPGSFTGLRIGLAAAKGLAYALQIPVVGVPTLAALACHYPMPGIYIAPLLDAQKGNAYVALYRWENGALVEVHAPTVRPFEEIICASKALDKPVVFLGEVAVKRQTDIQAIGGNVMSAMLHTVMPRAACVAALGQRMLASGVKDDFMTLEPLYIRRSEAEELWERRSGKWA